MKKMERFNRVLLLIPGSPESHYFERPLYAGVGYISESLLRNNIRNEVLDMRFDSSFSRLRKGIESFQPELIGVSMMTFKYLHSYDIFQKVKDAFPDIPIVVGGPHISTLREKVLEECAAIDYGVVLEGEETIIELCRGKNPKSIAGLIHRDGGRVVYNGDRPFITDLDNVSFPKFSQFDLEKYDSFVPLVTSRGCPFKCTYCPVQTAIGKNYRFRSPENIAGEILWWHSRGFKRFGIADDIFNLRKERVFQLCDELDKVDLPGLRLSCGNGIRADKVDRQLLSRMKDVGFYQISFGVEAGNDKILKNLQKGEKMETIRKAVSEACDLGYEVGLFFLLGSPGETRKDVEDSVNLALSFPVTYAPFYNLIPFPNTELFDWVEKNGYFLKQPEEYLNDVSHFKNEPVFETPELPCDERKKAWEYANRTVGRHCVKNKRKMVAAKFREKLGLPDFLNNLFSLIWCSGFTQNILLKSFFIRILRDKVMQK